MMDKQHIIYRTTNLLNGRFYIGKHSTLNIDDGYLGSGNRIRAEIKKYRKDNFRREVLEILESRSLLDEREKQIVNDELLKNPLCLNLKIGGQGGWEHITQVAIAKRIKSFSKVMTGRKYSSLHCEAIAKSKLGKPNLAASARFSGKTCTEEHRRKIGEKNKSMTGEKNSQFGSCWVTNGVKPITIKKEELQNYLDNGFRQGRVWPRRELPNGKEYGCTGT